MKPSMDSEPMNARQIENVAADWLVRRTSSAWSDIDQAQFDSWMGENLAHRIAYIRVESVWNEVGRLKAVGAGGGRGTVPPRDASLRWVPPVSRVLDDAGTNAPLTSARFSPRMKRIAASLALVGVLASGLYMAGVLNPNRYETQVGRIDTVALADGSNVTLNTDSRIEVEIKAQERRVQLDKGEAFFQVANDPARPFIVEVGDKRVIAVGTQFSVRRVDQDVRVTVTEGAVRLENTHGIQGEAKLLSAGIIARTRDQAVTVEQRSLRETEESLSWRHGYLVFRDSSLAEAVAEFNRYNTRKIIVADASIGAIQIGGSFRATSTDVFLWMLKNGFPVAVEERGEEVVIRAP